MKTLANIPKLMQSWDWEKNTLEGFDPHNMRLDSKEQVWWKCEGHSWQTLPAYKHAGSGCLYCSGKRILQGFNDLASQDSTLASEWHPTKNGDLTPYTISRNSGKKVWWLGKCHHTWDAIVVNRSKHNSGCPICHNTRVLQGFNDLAYKDPIIAEEWHPTKNGDLTPTQVTFGSHSKVWWQCGKGHEWTTEVRSRTGKNATGCLKCSKKQTSRPEAKIRMYLTRYFSETGITVKTGKMEKRQIDIIIDFGSRIIHVEYDGSRWHADPIRDVTRDIFLLKKIPTLERIIRIREKGCPAYSSNDPRIEIIDLNSRSNQSLMRGLNLVRKTIIETYGLPDQGEILFSPDENRLIHQQFSSDLLENSLGRTHPDLVKEWHPTKNLPLTFENVSRGQEINIWWRCHLGHEWETNINSRLVGHNCIYCSGQKVLKGFNDLATMRPDLAKEWNYEINSFNPDEITTGSRKKVSWKCKFEHTWTTTINSRNQGNHSCPVCSNRKVLKGFNDLATMRPDLAKEWNYEINSFNPDEITTGSGKKVSWKCEYNHIWEAKIYSRSFLKKPMGCPFCGGQKLWKGFNDLATSYPDLVKEWDFQVNKIQPTEVFPSALQKVWWKCSKNHSWEAPIRSRVQGFRKCKDCG